MIYTWLRRWLGVEALEDRLVLAESRLSTSILQSGHALTMIEEMSAELARVRDEAATRQRIMRDELMESEARTMTLIEELQTRASEPETDTLEAGPNKSGHTRWTERKRARVVAESNPAALARRIVNGNIQGNARGRDNRPGDGETQVPGSGQQQVQP